MKKNCLPACNCSAIFSSPPSFPLLLLSSSCLHCSFKFTNNYHYNRSSTFSTLDAETLHITIARYFVRHSTTLITRDAHFITSRRKNNVKKVRREKDCAKLRATPARLIGRTTQGIRKLRDQFHASPAAAMLHLLLLTALSHTLSAL